MTTGRLKLFLGGLLARRIDVWFFYGFLITFPLTIRKVITFYPIKGSFNEYTGIYIYLSDLFLIATLVLWGVIILCNNWHYLSIFNFSWLKKSLFTKKWLKIRINPLISLPILIVIWAFISITWSPNKPVALFRSIKLLEFFLLYTYIRQNFNNIFSNDLFHVEQINKNKFSNNCSTRNTENIKCSTWNINPKNLQRLLKTSLVILMIIGLFNSLLAFLQIVNNGSIGLQFLKESIFNASMPGVAKITLGNETFVRPYGLFPHPNILAAYLLLSIVITWLYINLFKPNEVSNQHEKPNIKQNLPNNNTLVFSSGDTEEILTIVPHGTIYFRWKNFKNLLKMFFVLHGTTQRYYSIFCSMWNNFWKIITFKQCKNFLFLKKRILNFVFHVKQFAEIVWNKFKLVNDLRAKRWIIFSSAFLLIFSIFGLYKAILTFSQNINNGHYEPILTRSAYIQDDAIDTYVNLPLRQLIYSNHSLYISLLSCFVILLLFAFFISLKKYVEQLGFIFNKFKLSKSLKINEFCAFSANNSVVSMLHQRNNLDQWKFIAVQKLIVIFKFEKAQTVPRGTFFGKSKIFCSTWNIFWKSYIFKKFKSFLFHVEHFRSDQKYFVPRGTSSKDSQNYSVSRATLYILLLFFPLFTLFLTFSKNAVIGLFIAILTINYQQYTSKNGLLLQNFSSIKPFLKEKILTKKVFLIMAILVMILVNIRPSFHSLILTSLDDRLFLQNVSRGTISENFFAGVGIGQFVSSMEKFSQMPLLAWQYQPVHNVFSVIWSELGLIGLLLFIGFIFAIFRSFRDTITDNPQLIHIKTFFRGLFLAFLFMLLFDHYLWDIQQGMILWWIILALV